MTARRAFPLVLFLAVACVATHLRAAALIPCPTASPLAEKEITILKIELTSSDSSHVAYQQAMGVADLSQADLIIETDGATCTAVTQAIQTYLRGAPPTTSNYLVIRAGARYIALKPSGLSDDVFSVTTTFQDVRISGGVR